MPAELALKLTWPPHHAQVDLEGLREFGHPEIRPQHTAMHEKLAAVFTYISAGTPSSPPALAQELVWMCYALCGYLTMLCRLAWHVEVALRHRVWTPACDGE